MQELMQPEGIPLDIVRELKAKRGLELDAKDEQIRLAEHRAQAAVLREKAVVTKEQAALAEARDLRSMYETKLKTAQDELVHVCSELTAKHKQELDERDALIRQEQDKKRVVQAEAEAKTRELDDLQAALLNLQGVDATQLIDGMKRMGVKHEKTPEKLGENQSNPQLEAELKDEQIRQAVEKERAATLKVQLVQEDLSRKDELMEQALEKERVAVHKA